MVSVFKHVDAHLTLTTTLSVAPSLVLMMTAPIFRPPRTEADAVFGTAPQEIFYRPSSETVSDWPPDDDYAVGTIGRATAG